MKTGLVSFLIVLLLMPIGHALMVLNELVLTDYKFLGAGIIGGSGVLLLFLGIKNNSKRAMASILGLLAAVLIWTGWIEFGFVWVAERLHVPPQIEGGEVTTKPEYLVMMSSIGLLGTFLFFYFFSRTKCTLFVWFQRLFKLDTNLRTNGKMDRPLSLISFMESIVIIWAFYILLLLVYDPDLFGSRHPFTYIVAYGSLIWSGFLIVKLLRIKKFDYAIRYAIPTVVIFWNFIEVLGRWGWFKEIWVHPFDHWIEITIMSLTLAGFIVYYFVSEKETDTKLT